MVSMLEPSFYHFFGKDRLLINARQALKSVL